VKDLLNEQAWLYIEHENDFDLPSLPPDWVLHREKKTSQTRLSLWFKPKGSL
jgi:16S rRNA G966 N2-methylase RsmD